MSDWEHRYPLRYLHRFYLPLTVIAVAVIGMGAMFGSWFLIRLGYAVMIVGYLSIASQKAFRKRSSIQELLADIPAEAEWEDGE